MSNPEYYLEKLQEAIAELEQKLDEHNKCEKCELRAKMLKEYRQFPEKFADIIKIEELLDNQSKYAEHYCCTITVLPLDGLPSCAIVVV